MFCRCSTRVGPVQRTAMQWPASTPIDYMGTLICRFTSGHGAGLSSWGAEYAMLHGQRDPHRHSPGCSPCCCVLCSHLRPAHAQAEPPQANAILSCQKRHCLLHPTGTQVLCWVLYVVCVTQTFVLLFNSARLYYVHEELCNVAVNI